MPVLISCTLSEPPSSIHCFRDITLYSSCFLEKTVLLECEKDIQDLYWRWLKQRGAWDFIADIVPQNKEAGITIREKSAAISVPRIDYDNLNFIISRLRVITAPRTDWNS
jgi:hypothetical protein